MPQCIPETASARAGGREGIELDAYLNDSFAMGRSRCSRYPERGRWALLILMLTLVGGCWWETVSGRYETVADARADGLFERGWVPDVLPDAAGPLRAVYDLDTNARCAVAEVPVDALAGVSQALQSAGFVLYTGAPPPPSLAKCPFGTAEVGAGSVLIRRTASRQGELAAVDERGTFYYWSARGEP